MLDNDPPERRFRFVLPDFRPLDIYDDSTVGNTVTEATEVLRDGSPDFEETYKSRDLKIGKNEGKETYKSRELKIEASTSEVDEPETTTTNEPTDHFTPTSSDFVLKLIFKK